MRCEHFWAPGVVTVCRVMDHLHRARGLHVDSAQVSACAEECEQGCKVVSSSNSSAGYERCYDILHTDVKLKNDVKYKYIL